MNEEQITTISNEIISHFNDLIIKYNLNWKDETKILQKLTQNTADKISGTLTIVARRKD